MAADKPLELVEPARFKVGDYVQTQNKQTHGKVVDVEEERVCIQVIQQNGGLRDVWLPLANVIPAELSIVRVFINNRVRFGFLHCVMRPRPEADPTGYEVRVFRGPHSQEVDLYTFSGTPHEVELGGLWAVRYGSPDLVAATALTLDYRDPKKRGSLCAADYQAEQELARCALEVLQRQDAIACIFRSWPPIRSIAAPEVTIVHAWMRSFGDHFAVGDQKLWAYDPRKGTWNEYDKTTRQALSEIGGLYWVRQGMVKPISMGDTLTKSVVNKFMEYDSKDWFVQQQPGVACASGFLFLDDEDHTVEQVPHDPIFRATHWVPIPYVEDAPLPESYQFLQFVLQSEEAARLLVRLFAVALFGVAPRVAHIGWITGRRNAGKDTMIKGLLSMINPEFVSNLSPEQLTDFGPINLHKKLINYVSEYDKPILHNIGYVKKLISGEPVQVNVKMKDYVKFSSKAQWFVTSNDVPSHSDTSEGFARRLLYFPCWPGEHPPEFRDRNEVLRLFAEERIKWLSFFAREASEMSKAHYRIEGTEAMKAAQEEWMHNAHPILAFVHSCCASVMAEQWTQGAVVYEAFKIFCKAYGVKNTPDYGVFGKKLKAFKGPEIRNKGRNAAYQLLLLDPMQWNTRPSDEEIARLRSFAQQHNTPHLTLVENK